MGIFDNIVGSREEEIRVDNSDLESLMEPYRENRKKIILKYSLRKLIGMLLFFCIFVFAMTFGWLWVPVVSSVIYIILYFNNFFKMPELTMNNAFYTKLSKLAIQDKETLGILVGNLQNTGYLTMDEVEKFVAIEKNRRVINVQLKRDGADILLKES